MLRNKQTFRTLSYTRCIFKNTKKIEVILNIFEFFSMSEILENLDWSMQKSFRNQTCLPNHVFGLQNKTKLVQAAPFSSF